jgi:hypothetical protein
MDPDPDADPSIFITDLQDSNKNKVKKKAFLYSTFLRYLYIIFKDKKSKRCHKTAGLEKTRVFLKKPSPVGFFGFFWFFLGFLGFLGFFWVFLPRRGGF